VPDLQDETTRVLQALVRFNTVNPPGDERAGQEWLGRYLADAGFEVDLLGATPERPNLVARLRGRDPGPTLCYLSHMDTVLADPGDWSRDPWGGEVVDGFLWGRGALDMKSQTAAEAVAAVALARTGWRPATGDLLIVCVADEEVGGAAGAEWICEHHPDKVRCDFLINEGAGSVMPLGDRRLIGVCCAEKGTFRFKLVTDGTAGHASNPRIGDNALLKLVPLLDRLGQARPEPDVTDVAAAFLRALGEDPDDPRGSIERLTRVDPELAMLIEPMLAVTFSPTMVQASGKINVIPSHAEVSVDSRVPPGHGEELMLRRLDEVLGAGAGHRLEWLERKIGNSSPLDTPLMDAIRAWAGEADPEAEVVPLMLPAFTDSRTFRAAFPECVAYGFFPHRHMTVSETFPLIHSADERIDVRDLGVAAGFFYELPRRLLG
jgi:acetylornithine deacetylase/succinyl-diaminopimelate desuccinylase-like protein